MRRWYNTVAMIFLMGCAVWTSVAQEPPLLASVDTGKVPVEILPFDLQFTFDVTAASGGGPNLGAEFDGTYFYTTRPLSNLIHKYTITGQFVEEFSIPGVTGLKDLAFDGTFMYGGNGAGTLIYQMDFVNHTLVNSIDLIQYPVRSIAYDSDRDAFWIGDSATPLFLADRNGTILDIVPYENHNLTNIRGLAYDNWSVGGSYLWAFNRGIPPPPGTPQLIHQIHLPTRSRTQFTVNVGDDLPEVANPLAGGLFTAEGVVPGTVSVGGVLQGMPNKLFAYELFVIPPSPPLLILPIDGAISVPTNVRLVWAAIPGADSYRVQVATDSSFTLPLVTDLPGLPDTSHILNGLANFTTYWWRVNATNAGGTSNYSAAQNFRTVVATPPVPVLVSPPDGAVNQDTTLTLEWNASTGATSYRVQVSTDASFAQIVADVSGLTDTSHTASGLARGATYWWRVNATNDGVTSNFSAPWNFRTIPARPNPPMLFMPVDGAMNQPTTLTLDWNGSPGAVTYGVQVATDPSFAPPLVADARGLTGTSYIVGGLGNGTIYWWQVNATNAGGTSDWSIVRSFVTATASPNPPPAPFLALPANGAVDQDTSLTLGWIASPGALSYGVRVATDTSFTQIVSDTAGLTGTSHDVGGLDHETTYWWQVNATGDGGPSEWSEGWSFMTVVARPPAPILVSPSNGTAGQDTSLVLVWNALSGALSYGVQVATDSTFTQPLVADVNGLTVTSYVVSGLANSTTYWWKVNAMNTTGTGLWSEVWSFLTTSAVPLPPTLISPANGSVNQDTSVTLDWNASTGATSYGVQVAADSSFAGIVVDVSGLTGTSQVVSGLARDATYYWRVNASNAGVTGEFSPPWNFMTIPVQPNSPALFMPIDRATDQPTTLTLDWNGSPGADSYRIQVSTDSSFAQVIEDTAGLTSTLVIVRDLASSTTYWWQVNATNEGGTSDWSIVWRFETAATTPNPPPVPVLSSPVNGAAGQDTSLTLVWVVSTGATSYGVQVATDSSFTQIVRDTAGVVATSYAVTGLDRNTSYWWRANAANAGGPSNFSAAWSFMTVVARPPAPLLVAPANGAVNQDTSLTLVWNASSGAMSYGVQVATDFSFIGIVVDVTGLAGTSQVVNDLARNASYYWKVNATNAGGTSAWSQTSSFTTLQSIQPPQPDTTVAGTVTDVRLVIPGGLQTVNDSMFYKRGGESLYVSIPMVRLADTLTANIPGGYVTIRGVEYYIKTTTISGQDILVNSPDDPGVIRVSVGAVPSPITFDRVFYRMISIPLGANAGTVDSILVDDFGPYDRRLWRVFRWEQGAYNEYDQIGSLFSPGSSFWLISHEGKGFDVDGGLSVDSDNPYSITLQPGWNQISSPFAFRTLWDTTGLPAISLPTSYDGTQYELPTNVLEPWEGYFVENTGTAPLIVSVEPREVSPALGKVANTLNAESDFELQFSATMERSNLTDTHNYVGILNDAGMGQDRLDYPEPPPITEYLRLSILEGEKRFMRNTKPLTEEGHFWDMNLTSSVAGQIRIGLTRFGSLPDGFSIYLLDNDRFAMIPIAENSFSIVTEKSTDVRSLRVILGTPEYAATNSGGIPLVPLEYRLDQNFPNPFNPATTIRYQLSERTQVTLELFNILGQRVRTLVNEEQVTGTYSVVWEGDNDAGNLVGSGVYLYRLTARDFVATRKLLLVR